MSASLSSNNPRWLSQGSPSGQRTSDHLPPHPAIVQFVRQDPCFAYKQGRLRSARRKLSLEASLAASFCHLNQKRKRVLPNAKGSLMSLSKRLSSRPAHSELDTQWSSTDSDSGNLGGTIGEIYIETYTRSPRTHTHTHMSK